MKVLPINWISCTLGELGTWSSGGTPSRARADFYQGSIPWIKTGELSDGPIADAEEHITEEALASSSAKVFPEGSLAIAMYGATIGKLGVLARPLATNQACAVLLADSSNREILPFVFNYLLSERGNLKNRGIGGAQPNISQMILKAYPAVLPPLEEQKRLCNALDSYLSRLDAAEAGLKRVQANLKRYRASVLKAAVEGRLVPTEAELAKKEGRTYEPASKLLERILKERRKRWEEAEFAKLKASGKSPKDDKWKAKYKEPAAPDTNGLPDLPEGWCWAMLPQLLGPERTSMKTGPFGSLLKKHEHQPAGVPVLGIENIEPMRFVPGSKIHISQEKAEELSGYDIEPGDVLISRSGTVGEVCVAPNDLGPARFSTNVMRVRVLVERPFGDFLAVLLNGSPVVRSQIRHLCSGTTRDFLNQEILGSLIFPLPPLAEQRRILAEIARVDSVAMSSQTDAARDICRINRLRQSILKWAFEGKLVDQDPNDEPASVLLERIRAERDGTEKPTKSRSPRAKKKAS